MIRPAPDWTDWDPASEAIHRIPRETLVADGTPHEEVAHRMIEQLTGHDLLARAPSWDGKWMSALLRAAALPRDSLPLRDTDEAQRETAIAILVASVPPRELEGLVCGLLAHSEAMGRDTPANRALADAQVEHGRWLGVR